jgi:hypothetical protein
MVRFRPCVLVHDLLEQNVFAALVLYKESINAREFVLDRFVLLKQLRQSSLVRTYACSFFRRHTADLIHLFSIFVNRASSQPSYFSTRLSTSESFSGLCFRNRDTTLAQNGLTVLLPTSLNRFVGAADFATEATDVVPPDMAMKQFLTLSIVIVLFQ